MSAKAYLEVAMVISEASRPMVARVCSDYRRPLLPGIQGAVSKELLIRDEDVQVLRGFDSVEHTRTYLEGELFQNDVFVGLEPLRSAGPEAKIYLAV